MLFLFSDPSTQPTYLFYTERNMLHGATIHRCHEQTEECSFEELHSIFALPIVGIKTMDVNYQNDTLCYVSILAIFIQHKICCYYYKT